MACPDGTRPDGATNTCIACSIGCKTCDDVTQEACTATLDGWYLVAGQTTTVNPC